MRLLKRFFHGLTLYIKLIGEFCVFLSSYLRIHLVGLITILEAGKNILVRFFQMKRGRYTRPFLHISTIMVLGIGIMVAPLLADTFPLFAGSASALDKTPSPNAKEQSIAVDTNVFQTQVSSQLRSKIIDYTVEKGDTVSSIAQKFGISEDTIKWANDLNDDSLSVGDTLKILPVSGIAYKVQSGDTVYSIAKKLATDAQKIVDFPFNDFANPETFSLVTGQTLIVPDGVQPSAQPSTYTAPVYASVPEYSGEQSGGFIWPIRGLLTQYFSLYHTGLDIAGPAGTPIYAAKAGAVDEASCGWNYGYGCHVMLSNGGGYETMYAHMVQQPSVSVGQTVSQGQLIGYRGSTGRSTGNHTHFEIRVGGHVVNPLPYLP
ncbi:MAG TPA: M23 family metallopeptidase [Candidatus Eisenbacteria bacterium]|nr:M23 family metallopeptidase [Candidatus Eisenbacteria bacterium]